MIPRTLTKRLLEKQESLGSTKITDKQVKEISQEYLPTGYQNEHGHECNHETDQQAPH